MVDPIHESSGLPDSTARRPRILPGRAFPVGGAEPVTVIDRLCFAHGSAVCGALQSGFASSAVDRNGNVIPDSCEIALDPGLDCNSNGMPDDCEQPTCAGLLAGDMDCSGLVDMADLPEFLDYLLSGFPSCRADINGDQAVDGRDIDPFVTAVLP